MVAQGVLIKQLLKRTTLQLLILILHVSIPQRILNLPIGWLQARTRNFGGFVRNQIVDMSGKLRDPIELRVVVVLHVGSNGEKNSPNNSPRMLTSSQCAGLFLYTLEIKQNLIYGDTLDFVVPGGRIELPWITPHDFESCASTNSAIPAIYIV